MLPALIYATTALALVVAAAAGVCAVQDRLPGWPTVIGLIALEALLLGVLVAGVAAAIGSDRDLSTGTFLGYLATVVLLPPIATGWAIVDRTRWGTAVIVVAALAVAVMLVRTQQIWTAAGG